MLFRLAKKTFAECGRFTLFPSFCVGLKGEPLTFPVVEERLTRVLKPRAVCRVLDANGHVDEVVFLNADNTRSGVSIGA